MAEEKRNYRQVLGSVLVIATFIMVLVYFVQSMLMIKG